MITTLIGRDAPNIRKDVEASSEVRHAEKVKVQDLPNGLATYASTSTRHAIRIDEQFVVMKETGEVSYTSEPNGGYLVWNGKDGAEFAAWIVQKDIFEQSYEQAEGAA